MKLINYAHINIFHKKGYWFKIWMEFLRPLLAKIELVCQQLAMPQLSGVEGVAMCYTPLIISRLSCYSQSYVAV